MREVAWLLDYLDEIESDFSVFHRVESIEELTSARWFKLAERLPAYEGILRAVLTKEQQDREDEEENIAQADVIESKMRTSIAQFESGKSAQAQVEVSSIKSIIADPEMLAKAREMATIARGGD